MAKEVTVFSLKKDESVALPAMFTTTKGIEALAQAYHVFRSRQHPGLARVQTRGEVSLTTKKMYKQKHTGNARHGAASAPIFVGGGVTHGPKGIKRVLTMPKSMKATAKSAALSMKVVNKELAFINVADIVKTREAAQLISKTGAKRALVAFTSANWEFSRAFRNIANVEIVLWDSINAYDVMESQMVLIDSAVLEKKEKSEKAEKVTKVAAPKKATVKKAAAKTTK